MDSKTFLLTLVLGFLAMMVLGTYCGIPAMGPIMAIAVAGGRIAWLLPEGQGGPGPSSERMTPIRPFPTHRIGGFC